MHHAIPKADGVIGISKFLTDFYERKGLPVLRIPAIIDIPDHIPEKLIGNDDVFNIVYVGKLIRFRGTRAK